MLNRYEVYHHAGIIIKTQRPRTHAALLIFGIYFPIYQSDLEKCSYFKFDVGNIWLDVTIWFLIELGLLSFRSFVSSKQWNLSQWSRCLFFQPNVLHFLMALFIAAASFSPAWEGRLKSVIKIQGTKAERRFLFDNAQWLQNKKCGEVSRE